MDIDFIRPCKTHLIRDNFKDHVERGSVLPGVDYGCDTGENIWATANGIVVGCSNDPNQVRGKNVTIRHRDGYESHYLHLSKVSVRNGQRVKMHDIIGQSGNTGTTSTGAHLHFAIKHNGVCIDPAKLLRKEKAEARKEKAAKVEVVAEAFVPTHGVVPE
jgi:murein DD-endopeptidase MepM/ murein hydrolase activator NlpD